MILNGKWFLCDSVSHPELFQNRSPCQLVFRSDERESGSYVASFKGISEKQMCILQRDTTESERRQIAMTDLSGYHGYTVRADKWNDE